MVVNLEKARELMARPAAPACDDELHRDGAVFFVGTTLPARPTLEAIFDSDCLAPADLFCFRFSNAAAFQRSEELVRLIKRNFKGYILGQFIETPSFTLLGNAYAAGIDLLDLPLGGEIGTPCMEERQAALSYATTVFPRWATAATLQGWEKNPETAIRTIDDLLERQILPLATLDAGGADLPADALRNVFEHLKRGWRRKRATVKPFLPLLHLRSPLTQAPARGLVASLFDKIDDTRLRTTTDLRRLLRVREVVESFDSAGL